MRPEQLEGANRVAEAAAQGRGLWIGVFVRPDYVTSHDGTGLTTHPIQEGQSYFLETSEKLTAPFFVLQGMKDKVCDYKQTQKFMKQKF